MAAILTYLGVASVAISGAKFWGDTVHYLDEKEVESNRPIIQSTQELAKLLERPDYAALRLLARSVIGDFLPSNSSPTQEAPNLYNPTWKVDPKMIAQHLPKSVIDGTPAQDFFNRLREELLRKSFWDDKKLEKRLLFFMAKILSLILIQKTKSPTGTFELYMRQFLFLGKNMPGRIGELFENLKMKDFLIEQSESDFLEQIFPFFFELKNKQSFFFDYTWKGEEEASRVFTLFESANEKTKKRLLKKPINKTVEQWESEIPEDFKINNKIFVSQLKVKFLFEEAHGNFLSARQGHQCNFQELASLVFKLASDMSSLSMEGVKSSTKADIPDVIQEIRDLGTTLQNLIYSFVQISLSPQEKDGIKLENPLEKFNQSKFKDVIGYLGNKNNPEEKRKKIREEFFKFLSPDVNLLNFFTWYHSKNRPATVKMDWLKQPLFNYFLLRAEEYEKRSSEKNDHTFFSILLEAAICVPEEALAKKIIDLSRNDFKINYSHLKIAFDEFQEKKTRKNEQIFFELMESLLRENLDLGVKVSSRERSEFYSEWFSNLSEKTQNPEEKLEGTEVREALISTLPSYDPTAAVLNKLKNSTVSIEEKQDFLKEMVEHYRDKPTRVVEFIEKAFEHDRTEGKHALTGRRGFSGWLAWFFGYSWEGKPVSRYWYELMGQVKKDLIEWDRKEINQRREMPDEKREVIDLPLYLNSRLEKTEEPIERSDTGERLRRRSSDVPTPPSYSSDRSPSASPVGLGHFRENRWWERQHYESLAKLMDQKRTWLGPRPLYALWSENPPKTKTRLEIEKQHRNLR